MLTRDWQRIILKAETNSIETQILHGTRNASQLIVNHTYPIAFEIPRRAASHRGQCRSSIVG